MEVDISTPKGADIVRRLALQSDVVIENFRVGGLKKYGLDHETLRAEKPDLVWCAITGFGQTGPDAMRGGYDFLVQGLSGLMSVTGLPPGMPGGGPMKVGVPISDLVTALYATVSILAALNHRVRGGGGQFIDLALLDAQVALMSNQAAGWLNAGVDPVRQGNQHPNLTPYQVFACKDGEVTICALNDRQFASLCDALELEGVAHDPQFATNAARTANRDILISLIADKTARWTSGDLLDAMDRAKVPAGRINSVPQAMSEPQVEARGLIRRLARADGTQVAFPGFPAQLSDTPATYRHAPPVRGQDTRSVLAQRLGMSESAIEELLQSGAIGTGDGR
jgi:formyl-CoA transferase